MNESPQAQVDFAERQQEKATGVKEDGVHMSEDVQQAFAGHSEVGCMSRHTLEQCLALQGTIKTDCHSDWLLGQLFCGAPSLRGKAYLGGLDWMPTGPQASAYRSPCFSIS